MTSLRGVQINFQSDDLSEAAAIMAEEPLKLNRNFKRLYRHKKCQKRFVLTLLPNIGIIALRKGRSAGQSLRLDQRHQGAQIRLTVIVPANATASIYIPSTNNLADITENGIITTNGPPSPALRFASVSQRPVGKCLDEFLVAGECRSNHC